MNNKELNEFFSQFGNVRVAYVKNPGKKKSKGTFRFGFVTFEDEEVADEMVEIKFFRFRGKKIFTKAFKAKGTQPKKVAPEKDSRREKTKNEIQDRNVSFVENRVAENQGQQETGERAREGETRERKEVKINSQEERRSKNCCGSDHYGFGFFSNGFKEGSLIEFIRQKHRIEGKFLLRINKPCRKSVF